LLAVTPEPNAQTNIIIMLAIGMHSRKNVPIQLPTLTGVSPPIGAFTGCCAYAGRC